jgi:hypothetical protein
VAVAVAVLAGDGEEVGAEVMVPQTIGKARVKSRIRILIWAISSSRGKKRTEKSHSALSRSMRKNAITNRLDADLSQIVHVRLWKQ